MLGLRLEREKKNLVNYLKANEEMYFFFFFFLSDASGDGTDCLAAPVLTHLRGQL